MSTTNVQVKAEKTWSANVFSSSIFVWLLLVAYLALVKLVILPLFPPIAIAAVAAIFSWDIILIAGFIGSVGLWIADRTGFMPALDPRVSNRQRYLIPVLIGGAIGTLASLLDFVTKGTEFIAENMGVASFNTDYPLSLFIYTSGTVIIEAIFRLFLFPVLLWLISYVILKKRWLEQTFWVLILLFSFLIILIKCLMLSSSLITLEFVIVSAAREMVAIGVLNSCVILLMKSDFISDILF